MSAQGAYFPALLLTELRIKKRLEYQPFVLKMTASKMNKQIDKKSFSSRKIGRKKKKVTAFPEGQQSNEKVRRKEKESTLPSTFRML